MKYSEPKKSIVIKFMMVLFLCTFLIILFSYLFLAWYVVESSEKKLLEDYDNTLEFSSAQISKFQKDIIQFTELVAADQDLQTVLSGPEKTTYGTIRRTVSVYKILRNYELLMDDCIGIELVLNDGQVYTSDSYDKDKLHFYEDIAWYQKITEGDRGRCFSEAHDFYRAGQIYRNVVTYVCDISNYISNRQKIGKLLVHIRPEVMKRLVYVAEEESSWCAIINEDHDLMAWSGNEEILQEELKERDLSGNIRREETSDGWLFTNPSLKCGSMLILFMSKDRLRGEETGIMVFFLILFLTSLLLTCLMSVFFSGRLGKPIRALSDAARQISDGNLDIRIPAERDDEIGMLSRVFNQMAQSLELQMRDLKLAEREKADLKMSILMGQMNPHFIYNTLDSAIYLSRIGEAQKAEQLLHLFVLLLQDTLKSGVDGFLCTVEEEIRDIEIYTQLQKIRYPERFDFKIEAEEKLYQNTIPRLLIQPLVENALNHGVLPNEFGRIVLRIYEKEERLFIEVEDDGEGMDEETLQKMLEKQNLKKIRQISKVHSISIENICQRLSVVFKEEYTFDVYSSEGKGTIVRISFPMVFQNQERKGEVK